VSCARGRFKLPDYLLLADLFSTAMMPQFISRFGSIAMLKELGKDELRQILVGAGNYPCACAWSIPAHGHWLSSRHGPGANAVRRPKTAASAPGLARDLNGLIASQNSTRPSPKYAVTDKGRRLPRPGEVEPICGETTELKKYLSLYIKSLSAFHSIFQS
jgi:ATP-dependent Clp protease ATP-binding subunit ClpX